MTGALGLNSVSRDCFHTYIYIYIMVHIHRRTPWLLDGYVQALLQMQIPYFSRVRKGSLSVPCCSLLLALVADVKNKRPWSLMGKCERFATTRHQIPTLSSLDIRSFSAGEIIIVLRMSQLKLAESKHSWLMICGGTNVSMISPFAVKGYDKRHCDSRSSISSWLIYI